MLLREATFADAHQLALVHVASWRTTYRGIVADDFLASMSEKERERRWQTILSDAAARRLILVAVADDGTIVGFASGGAHRDEDAIYTGELYALYLLAAHQRRGLGRQLVSRVALLLSEQGHRSMLVWVLAQNLSGRAFYERLGGLYVRTQDAQIGEQSLPEVAYGWRGEAFVALANGAARSD